MKPFDEKKYQYLLYLKDKEKSSYYYDFLEASKFFVRVKKSSVRETKSYDLHLLVNPEKFKKHQDYLKNYEIILRDDIKTIFRINVKNVYAQPDLENFRIFSNAYVPQKTPWQEINTDQENLLFALKKAKTIIDYQNIGNSSRTIMKKLTLLVFDQNKHTATEAIDLSEDKYKNRLHTYVKTELSGNENKDFRHFIESIITSCEKSIDLCNTLTHDLKATAFMAESSVIGILTTINFIRLVQARQS